VTATAEKTDKQIPTFSWLVRRAEELSRQDPEEFNSLRGGGTKNLLHGCEVHMTSGTNIEFHLHVIGGKRYCTIKGRMVGGEWYTIYDAHFSTTQWRKGMEKFMPFTMSAKPTWENGANCMFHNADGTVADYQGSWMTRRRGKAGSWSSNLLLMRDRDGKFIDCIKLDRTGKKVSGNKYEDHEFQSERKRVHEFMLNNIQNNDLLLGFLPGTCGKQQWYDSMKPPADRPNLWDERQVKLLAARAHAEAIRIAKESPWIKIALYPLVPITLDQVRTPMPFHRFSHNRRQHVALDWRDGKADLWLMPELIVYWIEKDKNYPDVYPDVVNSIRVQVPPSGNELLAMDGTSFISSVRLDDNRKDIPMAKAFHGVKCLKQGYAKTHTISGAYSGWPKKWTAEIDSVFVDFSKERELVLVNDLSVNESHRYRKDGEFIGMKPEEAFSALAERSLLESLPLC